jgi:MFS family permease
MFKTCYFVLEGLNSFSTVYYSYYLYFFMKQEFGFSNEANLALAALNGAIYMCGSFFGGRFAQRFGYFTSLKVGFGLMFASLAIGSQVSTAFAQVLVMAGTVSGMCFTWPALEALISEGESPAGLQRMVGMYNVVWAGTGSVSFFFGGILLDHLSLRSMFYVPAGLQLIQLGFTVWLESAVKRHQLAHSEVPNSGSITSAERQPFPELNPRPVAKARMFLRLAWVANPFAYVAIQTLIAIMPGLAQRLGLTNMLAGFCCSVWCFARFGAFVALRNWPGWHYRFRWLVTAYLALIVGFALILLVPSLLVLILAQVVFGVAVGLIYYSSLFYSMDTSDTKGEHGGLHEAVIGLGNLTGPAVGAASLHFLPQYPHSGAIGVSALLLAGLAGLLALRRVGTR